MDDDGAADLLADALNTSHALDYYANSIDDANRSKRAKRSSAAVAAAAAASAAASNKSNSNSDLPSTQQRPQWQLVTRLHASLCAEAVLLAQGAPPVVSSRALLRLRKLPAGPAVDVSPGDGSSAAAAAATAAEGSDDEDAASLRRLIARQHPQLLPYRPAGGFVDEETAAAASGDGATTASTRARVSTSSSSKHTTVPPSPAALLDVDLVLECVMEEAAFARRRATTAQEKLLGESALPSPARVLTASTGKGKQERSSAALGQDIPLMSPAELELRRQHAWSSTGPLILEFLKR